MEIFVDKSLPFVVSQPGGKRLEFYGPNGPALAIIAQAMMWQSEINCGKTIVGGGFNPSSKKQVEEFYKLAKELGL